MNLVIQTQVPLEMFKLTKGYKILILCICLILCKWPCSSVVCTDRSQPESDLLAEYVDTHKEFGFTN